jgi:hypothetical protein
VCKYPVTAWRLDFGSKVAQPANISLVGEGMALASFSPSEMRPTALMLNIVASSYSTWLFNRGRFADWAKLTPLLV